MVMFNSESGRTPLRGTYSLFRRRSARCFVDPVFSRSHVRSERTVDFFACNATLPTSPKPRSGSDSSEPPSLGTGAQLEPAESNGQQTPSTGAAQPCNDTYDEQSKRIFWVIPNYRAVNADTHLPAQTVKKKFWLGTQDSFDYSSFILAGFSRVIAKPQSES